jgi:hypothetical protein
MKRLLLALILTVMTTSFMMAATAKDIVETWTVDVEATWNKPKDMPQIKALPPEIAATAKSAFAQQSGGMLFTFTDLGTTTVIGGVKREETYVIISIDNDIITAEGTDPEGEKTYLNSLRRKRHGINQRVGSFAEGNVEAEIVLSGTIREYFTALFLRIIYPTGAMS